MKGIESWCVAVSAVSVVSGIITTLLPRSSIKNTYLILSGIVLLYICIQPVTDWREFKIDFEKIISSYGENGSSDEEYNSAMLYAAQETYKKYVNSILVEITSDIQCIECECEYNNGTLSIKKIAITKDLSSEQEQKLRKKLKDIIQDTTVIEFGVDDFEDG